MTKSQRFTYAWNISREAAVKFGGSVKSYFSEALKMTYKSEPKKTTATDIENELISRGLKVWVKNDLRRIYINGLSDAIKVLGYDGYQSNAFHRQCAAAKNYFDCVTGEFITDFRMSACDSIFSDYDWDFNHK